MKLEKVDHKHALTSWLKVIIFSILMLVPFIDVAIRCGYVMFNKNAYQSYSATEEVYKKTPIENVKRLYFMNRNQDFLNDFYDVSYLGKYELINFNITSYNNMTLDDWYTYGFEPTELRYTIELSYNQNDFEIYFDIINNEPSGYALDLHLNMWNNDNNNYFIDLIYIQGESVMPEWVIHNEFVLDSPETYYQYELQQVSTLDNVFDYSVNKISESPLYNWTRNTAVYTGVNAMCSGLGMPTDLVAILLTYWFILTIIYIIIDIVLNMFVWLTHMFNRKAT